MYDTYVSSHSPKFTTPAKYAKAKLKILKRDFRITPTDEEEAHMYALETQIAIDNAFISIINRRWDV